MAHTLSLAAPVRLRERWGRRPRRRPTILAPALPALILLAVTTAATVDPPRGDLVSQLHVPPATAPYTPAPPAGGLIAR